MKKPSKRLLKVLELMRTHPRAINMYAWRGPSLLMSGDDFGFPLLQKSLERGGSPGKKTIEEECRTPGCIAGWTAFLFPVSFNRAAGRGFLQRWRVAEVASRVLDIPEEAMHPNLWPGELRHRYNNSSPSEKYEVILEVLRYYQIDV